MAATWTITGANAGRINDGQAKFNTMESLIGGTANDTFVVGASGSVKGRIDGGGGVNKLDYIKVSGQTIVNLFDRHRDAHGRHLEHPRRGWRQRTERDRR